MSDDAAFRSGRHFLQIPGPSNVPDRVLRAMARPTVDHRSPGFAEMTVRILGGLQKVFQTTEPVILFPSSGTGAWEAALVNTLSPGDRVLAYETGHFATLWKKVAERLGLEVEWIEGDWRHGVDPEAIGESLRKDYGTKIKAVLAVHSETSTGVASRIPLVREAIDDAGGEDGLGSRYGQADIVIPGEPHEGGDILNRDVNIGGKGGRTAIARRNEDFFNPWGLTQGCAEGVFSSSGTDNEYVHA